MARALCQFAVGGIAALLLLAMIGPVALRPVGDAQALRQARAMVEVQAQAMQPSLTDGLVNGDPAARARFDRLVHVAVLNNLVVRVKLWTADGRVLYAQYMALVGQRFPLGEEQQEALRTGNPASDVSDQTAAENRFDHPAGRVIEVYQRVRSASGVPLLFESYLRNDNVSASSAEIWHAFTPALLVALASLYVLQLPIAWRLIRRLQHGQQERDVLAVRAAQASALERQRIAGDLHDGVVQTLAGVSYSLGAISNQVAKLGCSEVSQAVNDAGDTTRRSIVQLRTMIFDIYPPSLREAGLGPALRDLLAPLEAQGLSPALSFPSGIAFSEEVEDVLYRSAQEAIRNVVKHAGADHVDVVVEVTAGLVSLQVRDEGRGFGLRTSSQLNGHFGLRMLKERAARVGGLLKVDSVPGKGTVFTVEVPFS
jgi:signal transduction histidine kinase